MTRPLEVDLDTLRRYQEAALGVLARGVRALDGGPDVLLAASPGLRRELGEALGAYQLFKHERVFDPAIASGDARRAAMGRDMKVSCIGAGEVFRAHMGRWDAKAIANDWVCYKPAARLVANQLHRHIRTESEAIAGLLASYG